MDLQTRTGISGYSYKAWKRTFYPEGLSQDEWLSYYASQLPSVEINNTFYRMPRTHVVEALRKWQSRISASGAQNAFVFFRHEDDGAGPAMASRYLEIANGAKPRRTATKRTDAGAKPARAAPRKGKRARKSKPA